MEFKKQINCNFRDLKKAITVGIKPMETFYDSSKDNLPYFGNQMYPYNERFGNCHSPLCSATHIPGRWLSALLHAEDVTGIKIDENAVNNLKKWLYRCFDDCSVGLPTCMDLEMSKFVPVVDLHNMRENMYALYSLCRYRNDNRSYELALVMVRTILEFFDFEKGIFKIKEYYEKTGANITYSCCSCDEGLLFPPHFGRFIGPLTKFWKLTGEPEVIELANKLRDVCFKNVLNEAGDYDRKIFGGHIHSTTSMISSLAQLGDALKDKKTLDRVYAFLTNGAENISLPFGWCIENNDRQDLYGEVNNTSDIMESWLILGKYGYQGAYAVVEQILRGHFLPSQLFDSSFIPEYDDISNDKTYKLSSRSIGAFGFPTPFGLEDRPWISYNWDIVGGSVNGLCEAWEYCAICDGNTVTVPLLFAFDCKSHMLTDLYDKDGTAVLTVKEDGLIFRIRVPERSKIKSVKVKDESISYYTDGEWLYLQSLKKGTTVDITFELLTEDITYMFRGRKLRFRWKGEEIIAADAEHRKLCFFRPMD